MGGRGTAGLRVDLRGSARGLRRFDAVDLVYGKTQKWGFAGGSRDCGSGEGSWDFVQIDTNNAGGCANFVREIAAAAMLQFVKRSRRRFARGSRVRLPSLPPLSATRSR